jgi:hypothetical protein
LPADSSGIYDYSGHRSFLRQQIARLEAGEDVYVQAWELADELAAVAGLKSRRDQAGPKCFRITGDRLVPEEYERIGTPPPDPRLVLGTDEQRAEYERLKCKSRR